MTHTISRKIMIRRFDLACGCSLKKNIHRLVVVLEKPLRLLKTSNYFILLGRRMHYATFKQKNDFVLFDNKM